MAEYEAVAGRDLGLENAPVSSERAPREWSTKSSGVATLGRLFRQPADFCAMVANTFPGELVRIRVGPGSFVLATDPEHVEHILLTNASNYWKGDIFNTLKPIFGSSLLLSEGDEWRSQRRMMQPFFRIARLRSMADDFERIIEAAIEGWREGTTVDVERTMRNITLRIILHSMFSSSLREQDVAAIEVELERMLGRAPLAIFSWWAPFVGKAVLRRPALGLDQTVLRLIEQRRSAADRPEDLLTALIEATHDDGSALTVREIRDHVVTIIFGGYEATATALHWMWLMLGLHPDVRERVQTEVDSVRSPDEMVFVQQVIDETLRLYPPFWFSSRTAYEADQIRSYRLEAGTSVVISPYAVHRQVQRWPEPERFDPERFAPGKAPAHPCAYIPFLRGPRMCIGKHFAELEMRLITKVVARRWKLELSDSSWRRASIARGSLRPRQPPAVRVSRR